MTKKAPNLISFSIYKFIIMYLDREEVSQRLKQFLYVGTNLIKKKKILILQLYVEFSFENCS